MDGLRSQERARSDANEAFNLRGIAAGLQMSHQWLVLLAALCLSLQALLPLACGDKKSNIRATGGFV